MTAQLQIPNRPPTQGACANATRGIGNYLPTLDGWRTVAIAMVIFAHVSESMLHAIPVGLWIDLVSLKKVGLIGVQLFFGLSGFLITTKLLEEEARHGQISLASFYIRRSFRILPAAIFFLSVVGLLSVAGLLNISMGRWLSTLFFAANYTGADHNWYVGHFWSLAVEEHFYFLWPAAFLLLRLSQRRMAWVIGLALLIALWRAVDFKFRITGVSAAVFWGRTDIQADGILWGVLIALLYADPVWKTRLRQFFALPLSWPLLCFLLMVLEFWPNLSWKLSFMLMTVKALLMPLLILGTQIRSERWPGRILETPVFRWVGRLSYSLYLWQQLFLVWSEDRVAGLAWLQFFPVNLLAVFACATFSMLLIETPLIGFGHQLAKKMSRGGFPLKA
jgi:peptidoglycan/LPS O-acetylase OafA/YrhL